MSTSRLNQPSQILTLLTMAAIILGLTAAAAAQTETVISPLDYSFSALIMDSAGNLYGTTMAGGNFNCGNGFGCGTVFELSPAAGGGWTKTVLYIFNGGSDGEGPGAGLVFDGNGNLYGTTTGGGGSTNCNSGCGTIFKLSHSSGSGWMEKVLHSFRGPDGSDPLSSLTLDAKGNLYGTTRSGGLLSGCGGGGCGTIFRLSGSAGFAVLHVFHGKADGYNPLGPLTLDAAGNLYGVTQFGGNFGSSCGPGGCGVVFKLTPASGIWPETILHTFVGTDGFYPNGGLVFDASHHLYGTADGGGTHGYGVVFKLSTVSDKWTALYAFTGGSDGGSPSSGVIFDKAGSLYGTTNTGLANGCNGSEAFCGQVFKLSPGTTGWQLSAQYPTPFAEPSGGNLVLDNLRNIYGIANADLYYGDGGGAYQIVP
jgi:uncharacterized repeat protein (TIGR03803 family)